MTVDGLGQAATLGGMQSFMSGFDFLRLFAAQLEYQDPTAPMSNSELMEQVSQITQLQLVSDLTANMDAMMQDNQMLQASGMIGRTVEYMNSADVQVPGVVQEVLVEPDGSVKLGLGNGILIDMDAIRRVL